jgi:hypothetical protein
MFATESRSERHGVQTASFHISPSSTAIAAIIGSLVAADGTAATTEARHVAIEMGGPVERIRMHVGLLAVSVLILSMRLSLGRLRSECVRVVGNHTEPLWIAMWRSRASDLASVGVKTNSKAQAPLPRLIVIRQDCASVVFAF